jgi:hypothetical protein
MGKIEIVKGVPSEHATRVQEHYLAHYSVDQGGMAESYYSPDRTKVLILKWIDEVPFGFPVFSGTVRRLTGEHISGKSQAGLRFRRLLSPGAFGCRYDHWSGNPYSADASHLGFAEATDRKYAKFRMSVFDCASGRTITLMESGSVLAHHMWSNTGHYLFRDMSKWYLYSHKSRDVRVVYAGSSFPKHCHFDEGGERLILLDDNLMIKLLACDSLEEVATASMNGYLCEDDSITYSVVDPFENQLLLGIDARFGEIARSEKWLAVKM